ncbi:hypothetical protein TUM4438_28130 [Shewanella sairae]|uniref:Uncharacterized protein n=1 Tax=Shewanella sairae TaxID=190310 RepID=A0ABQ4PJT2_9GAMM|nr:hypothetical protein TUM4438_28130 [Shewanella sairae]
MADRYMVNPTIFRIGTNILAVNKMIAIGIMSVFTKWAMPEKMVSWVTRP